jgi:ubiquitin C-terminal hydrolase
MQCQEEIKEKVIEKKEIESKNKLVVSYRRFANLGNTCYMGSILHILQQIPIFADYFYTGSFRKLFKNKNIEDNLQNYISYHLYRLFTFSLSEDDRLGDENVNIRAESFRECIGSKDDIWLENNHQDSQELLNFLIYKMEEEIGIKMNLLPGKIMLDDKINNINKEYLSMLAGITFKTYSVREFSPLKNMFDGMLLTKTKCEYCSNIKNIFDPINMLQLSIPINNFREDLMKEYSLDDCLDFFLKQEQLDDRCAINCEFCSFKSRAYKNYLIWKTPKILIIHLKRFEKIKNMKLTNKISYPLYDLDLSKYMDPNSPHINTCKYNLRGINLHDDFNMKRINFGHYTSMVKNRLDNKWLFFNDGRKPELINKESSLQQKDAYMLFYERNN